MTNQELAKIFYEIGNFLQMEAVDFKPQAYKKAASALELLEEDIKKIYKKEGLKGLERISGIGRNIALKIEEYLKTGKIRYYGKLKKKSPFDLNELIKIEGLGVKKAKILYQKLGVKSLKDLKKAAEEGKIRNLASFGLKTEKNILEGIAFLKKEKGRFLLGEITPAAKEIIKELKNLKEVEKVSAAGSLRRMKETIGDVDILAVSEKPKKVMAFFVSLPGVVKIWGKGSTKSSIRIKQGFDIDLRVVPERSYGSALQYFTGSKEHNIVVRRIAMSKGLKLNEYGVFRNLKFIAGRTEKEVYKAVGLSWIAPEMRENRGEIELARKRKLPKLVVQGDILGDLHCHSDWNGGSDSIKEMALAAQEMGYQYLGIADHTKFLRIERGLDEKQLNRQRKEIDKLNSRFGSKFKILQGCEANILNDGSIDIKDEALKKLDYAIAGIHSNMKMSKEKMTERIIKAMKNPYINIISHPSGRLILRREAYRIDFEKILKAARETKTILEINSSPMRLDLKDVYIKKAKEAGVKMVINTDSHRREQMRFISFGTAQARRGWAEKKDIINTRPLKKLLKFFKQKNG